MRKPRVSLVVAMARNRVIGAQNKLPWNLPEDLTRFREITTGHPIIMGRKTFESIGRPLPNRTNIVISRDPELKIEGCRCVGSLDAAIAWASSDEVPGREEIHIIGGGEIFQQAISFADRIYLTLIDQDIPGDAYFPEFNSAEYRQISREERTGPIPFAFLVLDRLSDLRQ
jgi:dihydrofolate reductase